MKTWLLRPFDRVAGGFALTLGLLSIAATAALGNLGGLVSVGVLDLQLSAQPDPWLPIVLGGGNWLIAFAVLYVLGRWPGGSRFRVIDLLGTQALARWPLLPASAWLTIPAVGAHIHDSSAHLISTMAGQPAQFTADPTLMIEAGWLLLLSLPVLVCIAWMVWLMYHSFALVCHLQGPRAIWRFAVGLLVAEFLSKILGSALLLRLAG